MAWSGVCKEYGPYMAVWRPSYCSGDLHITGKVCLYYCAYCYYKILRITALPSLPSLNLPTSGVGARFYLWRSLSGRVRAIGWAIRWAPPALLRAVALTMVAMVVARQLEWLYNQLKVPTVSWIPYIPINLSSDRPWSRARSSDSNWCHLMYFFFLSSAL